LIYSYCRQQGITLFTVSHRKSLWKHHEVRVLLDKWVHVIFPMNCGYQEEQSLASHG
jgi:hypothetical protein